MEFSNILSRKVDQVNQIMTEYIPQPDSKYGTIIYEAIEYSLMSNGKRIRPILMYEAFTMCNGQSKSIYPFMAAMEMIHTYSLIHDDLPAMDDDDYRRGRLTCHKKFGEDIAVLAGDALLNYAFELMIGESLTSTSIDTYNVLKAMHEISKASGLNGMISGQVVDVVSEGKEVTLDLLDFIHKNKTSAIIEASLTTGATLANASKEVTETYREIGRCIGLAFQIQDDILDVTSTTEILGKPVGSDHKNGKGTYITLIGLEASKKLVFELTNQAIELLNSLGACDQKFVQEFILYLRDRSK